MFPNLKEFRMSEINNGFEFIKEIISKRWIPEILISIKSGNTYYSDILNSISYLSKTELNRKLHFLIDNNLITKSSLEEANRANYALSELGDDIEHIINHLSDLGNKYMQ